MKNKDGSIKIISWDFSYFCIIRNTCLRFLSISVKTQNSYFCILNQKYLFSNHKIGKL